jgi:hypothetical protein
MSNLLEQYSTGAFVLKVDGHELKIKPTNEEKLKLHGADKKLARLIKDTSEEADKKVAAIMEDKTEILKQSIMRADSKVTEDQAINVLMAKQSEIEEELGVSFGWYTREQLEKIRIKKLDMLDKEDFVGDKEK